MNIIKKLTDSGIIKSASQASRLVAQKVISIGENRTPVTDFQQDVDDKETVLWVGKKKIFLNNSGENQ